jgi:hypothetical protein
MTAAAQAQQRAQQEELAPTVTAGDLTMTAAGQAQERAQQEELTPSAVQTALPPPLPNPGGGNPKGKGPLSNAEQNVIQQGAAAVTTIVKAVITTVDPAVQACVDTAKAADCALAVFGGVGFFASDGASALDEPALAEGLGADTADAGLSAGEADTGTAENCLLSGFVPGGMSFTAATPVLLPGGKTAPIATLKPGDKVQATSTKTGKTSQETVAAVEVHHDTNLYDLNVKTPHGVQVIHTTANHLFWDPTSKQWVQAAKLRKGEHLKTPDGTVAVADGGITPAVHDGWMWDLTVPGNNDHDFYVAVGASAILVHNIDCPAWMTQETANAIRGAANTNVANLIMGNAARDAIAATFPESQTEVTFQTALGRRKVDVLTQEGMAIESKVGYVSYDSGIRAQVAKDQMLLESGQVSSVKWLFLEGLYGSGPSGALVDALERAGIQWGRWP